MAKSSELRPLSEARQFLIPRSGSGKPVAPSTTWRWHKKGIQGERLHVTYVGGKPMVSRDAIEDFFERVTAAKERQHTETIDATDAELEAAGLI